MHFHRWTGITRQIDLEGLRFERRTDDTSGEVLALLSPNLGGEIIRGVAAYTVKETGSYCIFPLHKGIRRQT